MREGRWKLLCEYDGSSPQLYDLDNDPGETTDLAVGQPEIVRRLTETLLEWHQSLPPDKGVTFAAAKPPQPKKGKKSGPQ